MVKYDAATYGDRADAGRVLANDLMCYRGSGAIVLTIPGSGIPVAVEAAKKIGSRLDIIVSRKRPTPYNIEADYGAVTEDGAIEAWELVKSAADELVSAIVSYHPPFAVAVL